jgi:peptidoglycan/xylan/chitin deacetylase (PgdA/CDA1 family)
VLAPGQTVVTITFDDGWASAATAAKMMTAHGLPGTFYLNSGNIGEPGYVSLADVDAMATSGHEIGGHSLTHPDLTDLSDDEARRQLCDDRKTLLNWGFPVRNFAYPFSMATPKLENIVRECGYNSARSLGELRTHHPPEGTPPELSCALCDSAETVPPADPMYTKAPAQVSNWTVDDLKGQVTDAIPVGGWVQLTFHKLCTTDCIDPNQMPGMPSIAMLQADFDNFLTWLAGQQAQGTVIVRTVGDVIGGPVAAPVAGPVAMHAVVNPGLQEQTDGVPSCWTHGGFGNNTPEFSLVPTGPNGTTASRLVMRNYVDGGAELLQTTDLGECAPAVSPGQTHTIQARYTSTVPTAFSVQYRLTRGVWVYGTSSPQFSPATEFTPARWTLPPIPEGVTAISFGLTLTQDGELVTDDYSLTGAS